jgi:hypothetical protein
MTRSVNNDEGSVESQRQPRTKRRGKRNLSHIVSDENRLSKLSSMIPTMRRTNAKLSDDCSGSVNYTNILVPVEHPKKKKKGTKSKKTKRLEKSKSRKSQRSAKERSDYKMSIDRIVDGDDVERQERLTSGKSSYKLNQVPSRSLLPSRKIITPFKKRKQSHSAEGSRKLARQLNFNSTKKKAFGVQQQAVQRLHSSVPRRFSQEERGDIGQSPGFQTPVTGGILRNHKRMRSHHATPKTFNGNQRIMFRHQSPLIQTRSLAGGPSHKRTKSMVSIKKFGKAQTYQPFEPQVRSFHNRFQEYRANLKALEKARYEKLLQQQKQDYEQKIKSMNTNARNRMTYMKQNLERERKRSTGL